MLEYIFVLVAILLKYDLIFYCTERNKTFFRSFALNEIRRNEIFKCHHKKKTTTMASVLKQVQY